MKRIWLLGLLLLTFAIPGEATTSPITEITAAECTAASTTCTPGTVAIGDLGIAFAYRSNSATAPSAMASWTTSSTACGTANVTSCRVACAVATTTSFTAPSSANATHIIVLVFRGTNAGTTANCGTTGLGGAAVGGASSNSIAYNAITSVNSGGSSWVVGCAGHVTASNVNTAPPGMTLQQTVGAGPMASCFDTQAGVTSWGTQSVTVNASSGWRSYVVEIQPAPCSNTMYGAYTCVQKCLATTASGVNSLNCVMPSNITSGNFVFTSYYGVELGVTLSITGCSPVTFTQPDTTVSVSNGSTNNAWGVAGSSAACTITANKTGAPTAMEIGAVEISGSNGVVDQHALASQGSIASGGTINAPNVTTTQNGEFIISSFLDATNLGTRYTAGTGAFAINDTSAGRMGLAIQLQNQASLGSITPTATGDNTTTTVSGIVSLKPTGGASVFAPQVGGFLVGP